MSVAFNQNMVGRLHSLRKLNTQNAINLVNCQFLKPIVLNIILEEFF